MQKNVIITLVFALFITVFAILNAGKVPVNLLIAKIELSAALVILISGLLGAVAVYSLDMHNKRTQKKTFKELEEKVLSLEKQNELLRKKTKEKAPIKDQAPIKE